MRGGLLVCSARFCVRSVGQPTRLVGLCAGCTVKLFEALLCLTLSYLLQLCLVTNHGRSRIWRRCVMSNDRLVHGSFSVSILQGELGRGSFVFECPVESWLRIFNTSIVYPWSKGNASVWTFRGHLAQARSSLPYPDSIAPPLPFVRYFGEPVQDKTKQLPTRSTWFAGMRRSADSSLDDGAGFADPRISFTGQCQDYHCQ